MKTRTEIQKARWTGDRIARLGFLLGLGWDARRIAEDPLINSTPNNVHRQALRFGLAFRAAAAALALRLPPEAADRLRSRGRQTQPHPRRNDPASAPRRRRRSEPSRQHPR